TCEQYKNQKVALAIGIFDGLHRGHQRIIKGLVAESEIRHVKSLVVTFHPHPRKVLNPRSKTLFLLSLDHRLKLIKEMGVDRVSVIRFTRKLSSMSPDDFIREVLIRRFNVKTLVVGRNFLFGHRHKGDFVFLKKMGRKYGFRVIGVKPVKLKNKNISSTRIRKTIESSDLKNAALMLARPVTVLGTVVRGRRVGRKLGFPTANINPHHEAIPQSGVYAVDVMLLNKKYRGILNIGTRPTFGKGAEPTIELHIFNFNKNIYGKDIEIIFNRKIRNEKRFSSIEALKRQIQKDISIVLSKRSASKDISNCPICSTHRLS
ncbi:MAG: bifunctional riboflavin kinase/FAD synthetase, partial [Candidatus Omnitrophica bacterium]|nr:bifunctional riboflavin kinase/FAD synthetase [Candidatus Omnitrophota bacterium]